MSQVWDWVDVERRSLGDVVAGLTDAQWQAPSAVKGWRVADAVSHLVLTLETSVPAIMWKLLLSGGSLAAMSRKVSAAEKRTPAQIAEVFRHPAHPRFNIPGMPAESALTEIMVHALDVKWPLGIKVPVTAEHARTALDFLVSPMAARGFSAKGLADGLRFEASDVGWTHGSGPSVVGTADALLLSLCARAAALDALNGDGVATFRTRFGKHA